MTPTTPAEIAWHPIDTAPKDGRRIIVYRPVAAEQSIPHVGEDLWNYGGYWARSNKSTQPTLWQPMPAPPK